MALATLWAPQKKSGTSKKESLRKREKVLIILEEGEENGGQVKI